MTLRPLRVPARRRDAVHHATQQEVERNAPPPPEPTREEVKRDG